MSNIPWLKSAVINTPDKFDKLLGVLEKQKMLSVDCLHPKTRIKTNLSSRETILNLYDRFQSGQKLPLAESEIDGCKVYKEILGVYRRPVREDYLYEVSNPLQGKMIVSPEHAFFNQRGEIEAQHLKTGDKVYVDRPCLDNLRRQMILGTLMGDSNMRKRFSKKCNRYLYSLTCQQGEKQLRYLKHKLAVLGDFTQKYHINRYVDKRKKKNGDDVVMYKFSTILETDLEEIYNLCHREGQRYFSKEWLSQLTPLSLLYWFGDDGSYEDKSAAFHVQSRTKEEVANIVSMFKSFGLEARVSDTKKGPQVYFSYAETVKLLDLLPYCPSSDMSYKIPKPIEFPFSETKYKLESVKVKRVKPKTKYLYDMTVKDTHKYFAQHYLVHNTETRGLDPTIDPKNFLIGISISWKPSSGVYLPINHVDNITKEQADRLWKVISQKFILFFNAFFDRDSLESFYGKDTTANLKYFDVMGLVYVENSDAKKKDLKTSAKIHLGRTRPDYMDTLGKKSTFDQVPLDEAHPYAAGDSCFDKDSEVLTRNGWVRWSDYKYPTQVGTINLSTGYLQYQTPTDFHCSNYKGNLIQEENRIFKSRTTPNHNYIIKANQNKANPWTLRPQKDLKVEEISMASCLGQQNKRSQVLEFTSHAGKQTFISSEDFTRLCGLVLSDGWVKTRTKTSRNYSVGIVVCKDTWAKEIDNFVMRECPFEFKRYEKPGRIEYVVSHVGLHKFLKPYALKGARTKYIPEVIFKLPKKEIEQFLLFYRYGDGSLSQGKDEWETSSKRMAEDLQRLHLLTGRVTKIGFRKGKVGNKINGRLIKPCDMYFVYGKQKETFRLKKSHRMEVPYDGKVYCVSVPNRTLVSRCDSKIMFTGNSDTFDLFNLLYPKLKVECPFTLKLDDLFAKELKYLQDNSLLYIDKEHAKVATEQLKSEQYEIEKGLFKLWGHPINLQCIPFDTIINTNFGKITLLELYQRRMEGYPVYVETPKGNVKLVDATKIPEEKEEYEIEFEDGSKFYCSEDHEFLVNDKEGFTFKKLKNLQEGDEIHTEYDKPVEVVYG